MMHPDISPNQFEEGIKNGHYMVNLSVNQTFSPPEFHASEGIVFEKPLLANTNYITNIKTKSILI